MRDSIQRRGSTSTENEYLNEYATLKFEVEFPAEPDASLYISGNLEELGNWEIENALELRTTKNKFPIWETENCLSYPIGMTIEYHYVLVTSDGVIKPEKLPNNGTRSLTMKQTGDFIIKNKKDDLELKILPLNEKEKKTKEIK